MMRAADGHILDTNCQAIVNPVNCRGVQGAGLAKAVKLRFPERSRHYERLCRKRLLRLGDVVLDEIVGGEALRYILHMATKDDWKNPSRIEWIADGLNRLKEVLLEQKITSVALPAVGCGRGGLDWQEVRQILWCELKDFNLEHQSVLFDVYPPKRMPKK